ncbi:MAG: DUF4175 family protein [Candidatus Latescibacterota bacterium]
MERLRALGRVEADQEVRWGFLRALVLLVGVAGVAVLVEFLAYLPSRVRVGVLGMLLLFGIGLFVRLGLIPWVRRRSLETLALKVEAKHPELKQRLIGALQLGAEEGFAAEDAEISDGEKRTPSPPLPLSPSSSVGSVDRRVTRTEGYSSEMIAEVVRQASEMFAGINLGEIVDRARVRRYGKMAGLAVGLFLGCALLFDGFGDALVRYSHPLTAYKRPQETRVKLTPGDVEVIKGQDVNIEVALSGKAPDRVTLHTQEADMLVWRETDIATGGKDTVSYVWQALRISAEYFVEAGDGTSDRYHATVIERPRVQRLQVTFEYPPHTGLGIQVASEGAGDLRAWVGTKVRFEAIASKPLGKAQWVMDDGRVVAGEVADRKIRAAMEIAQTGTYHIALEDRDGIPNADPIEYQIEAVPDDFPGVAVLEPGQDTDLAESMLMPLLIEAQDDFGVSKMEVVYTRVGSEQVFSTQIPLKGGGQGSGVRDQYPLTTHQLPVTSRHSPLVTYQMDFVWDLSALDLLPEDRVQYHVAVWDNDAVSGPKQAQSASFLLRLPSMHEIFRELVAEQEDQVTGMEEMLAEEEQLREKVVEMRRQLLREEELGWERRKELEGVLDRQEQIAAGIQQLADRLDEMIAELERRDLAAEETLAKLAQIRQLMEEMASPELRAAMEALRQAMEKADPEALRKAMETFEFSQEAFEEQLDRTLSLLKRLQLEQRMDAAVKMAEVLAERQERINSAMEAGEDPKQLAGQEKQVERDLSPLSETLAGLLAAMSETDPALAAELDSLRQAMEGQGIQEDAAQLAQQLGALDSAPDQQTQKASAGQMGKKIAGELGALSSGLKRIRESLRKSWLEQVTEEMRGMLRELLTLSEHQEALAGGTTSDRDKRLTLPDPIEQQQDLLEGTTKVADQLCETAGKSFFVTPSMGQSLGDALEAMERAKSWMVEGNSFGSRINQQEAMTALNRTAMQIHSALGELASAQSGTGVEEMMEQLQALSGAQEGINQQTMPFGQGKKPGLSGQALMEQLAARQLAAQQGLQELLNGLGERGQPLGRLDRTVEEMRRVAEDLKRGRVEPETIERQERILSRLLDAQRSLEKREYSRRREAERAEAFQVRRPGALPEDLGERERALREDLTKALKEGYSEEYQQLIRRYFEAIGRGGGKMKSEK